MTNQEARSKAQTYRALIADLYDGIEHVGVALDISDAIDKMDDAILKLNTLIDNEQETT